MLIYGQKVKIIRCGQEDSGHEHKTGIYRGMTAGCYVVELPGLINCFAVEVEHRENKHIKTTYQTDWYLSKPQPNPTT